MQKQLNKLELFPTLVYYSDNVLDEEHFNIIHKHVFSSYKKREEDWQKLHNKSVAEYWQSLPDLHFQSEYTPLTNQILFAVKSIIQDYDINVEDFYISGMWSNVLKKGQFHRPHTHSNNYLTGVFYVESDITSSHIEFMDPRSQANVMVPEIITPTKYNSQIWYLESIKNRLVIFPSWLQHYVPVNNTDNMRSSISFNISLAGKVNTDKSLQSAVFPYNDKIPYPQ